MPAPIGRGVLARKSNAPKQGQSTKRCARGPGPKQKRRTKPLHAPTTWPTAQDLLTRLVVDAVDSSSASIAGLFQPAQRTRGGCQCSQMWPYKWPNGTTTLVPGTCINPTDAAACVGCLRPELGNCGLGPAAAQGLASFQACGVKCMTMCRRAWGLLNALATVPPNAGAPGAFSSPTAAHPVPRPAALTGTGALQPSRSAAARESLKPGECDGCCRAPGSLAKCGALLCPPSTCRLPRAAFASRWLPNQDPAAFAHCGRRLRLSPPQISCARSYRFDGATYYGACGNADNDPWGSWCVVDSATCPGPGRAHGPGSSVDYDYCQVRTQNGCFCSNTWSFGGVTYNGTCRTGACRPPAARGDSNDRDWRFPLTAVNVLCNSKTEVGVFTYQSVEAIQPLGITAQPGKSRRPAGGPIQPPDRSRLQLVLRRPLQLPQRQAP